MSDHKEYIEKAKAVKGGHLLIGQAGTATIHFDRGATLTTPFIEEVKKEALEAGLPVIDSRKVDFADLCEVVFRGPLTAVGEEPDPPQTEGKPYHALSRAPFEHVADLYRKAGAELHNI